jgi:hypothetical protein
LTAGGGATTVQIDSGPNFANPIITVPIVGGNATISTLASGLVPGNNYYFRSLPSVATVRQLISPGKLNITTLGSNYLRNAWISTGTSLLHEYGGLSYVPASGPNDPSPRWTVDNTWNAPLVSENAYFTQMPATLAIEQAVVLNDLATLDDLAQFYNLYRTVRMTTFGYWRHQAPGSPDVSTLIGPDSTQTTVDIQTGTTTKIWECPLCNEQFFHPVARLIRAIAGLNPSDRTTAMDQFVQNFLPIVVTDQLLRNEYGIQPYNIPDSQSPEPGLTDQPTLVALWNYKATTTTPPLDPSYHAMTDNDLWLIGGTAEILGANSTDPTLAPIDSNSLSQLLQAMQKGVSLLNNGSNQQANYHPAHLHASTVNFSGQTVGSVSYFDGDWVNLSDNAFAGYTQSTFPGAGSGIPTAKVPTVSWDISHYSRVPIMFRSLYDNRKAFSTLTGFPQPSDIQLAVNQLLYVVLQPKSTQGSPSNPGAFSLMFDNFMDGSNGWFRVGYNSAPQMGYGPAQLCNAHATDHPLCLENSGFLGTWGLLANFQAPSSSTAQSDLTAVVQSALALGQATDSASLAFKDRYYFYIFSFAPNDPSGYISPAYMYIAQSMAPALP